MRRLSTLVTLIWLARAAAADPVLPADARLDSARVELDQLVAGLAAQGLPAELLVAKVREGLAKQVPVARILVVARKLGVELVEVDALARRGLGLGRDSAPPGLLAALIDARTSGAAVKELAALIGEAGKENDRAKAASAATRAATSLADLAARGYPSEGVGALVGTLARGDGRKLGRLAGALETLRKAEGLTPGQALELVRAAIAAGGDPDSAVRRGVSAGVRGKGLTPDQNKLKTKDPRK